MTEQQKYTFPGGVHPPDMKDKTAQMPIETLPAPQTVRIPISQHIGAPAKPIVSKNDTVKLGQTIAESGGFVSTPIHASISGKVKGVKSHPDIFGRMTEAIIIENDGEDSWLEGLNEPDENFASLSNEEKKKRLTDAGLVGMGGATFPLHVKLSPPKEKPIDTFILNGVECEPYLTADHRLMLEHPEEILEGGRIFADILEAKHRYIGIEKNKPDAIKIMMDISEKFGFKTIPLELKYPQGAEKQLIYAITKREVPAGGLPMDVGCVVNNVGTAFAGFEAVKYRKPLIERVLTITGNAVEKPGNFCVRIGTHITELLEKAGGTGKMNKLILGGPMMGLAQPTSDIVVIKGTSGILLMSDIPTSEYENCIRCGKCVTVCPMGLNPGLISIEVEADLIEYAENSGTLNCMECGACTYICPAKRPIVHFIKHGKAAIAKMKKQAASK